MRISVRTRRFRFSTSRPAPISILEAARAKAQQWHIPKACTVEELLADESIEFVVNLTIPRAHGQIMADCLRHGKSVYTEKPFTVTRDEARQTLALAGRIAACAWAARPTRFWAARTRPAAH